MRLALLAVLASVALAGAAVSASAGEEEEGKERWAVKTMAPPPGQPVVVLIETLIGLGDVPGVGHNDARFQSTRIPGQPLGSVGIAGCPPQGPCAWEPTEGEAVTTTGWLHLVAFETDGDFHVQLSASPTQGSPCLIVEIPDPKYVSDPTLKAQATAARAWIVANVFAGELPAEGGTIVRAPVKVQVTGALFFDDSHVATPPRGKQGMKAGTLWELHPVTAIGPAA